MFENTVFKPYRFASFSFLLNKNNLTINLILCMGVISFFLISMGVGTKFLSPEKVVMALLGDASKLDIFIVRGLRLPRALMAIFTGGALAIAGLLLQTTTKNNLASPSILGIVEGASLAAVLFLAIFGDFRDTLHIAIEYLPVVTTIGSLAALTIVIVLSRLHQNVMLMLVLYGVSIAVLCKALTNLFLLLAPVYRTSGASVWLTGDLASVNTDEMAVQAAVFVSLTIPLFALSRPLDALVVNDDIVESIGVRLKIVRASAVILAALFTACAVSFASGISFVGLVAPHIARMLVGQSFRALIFTSMMIGAIVVIIADLFGRMLLPTLGVSLIEIPTGVFTAVIGAPYFFYLIYQGSKARI